MIPTANWIGGLPKPYLHNYLRDQQVRTLVVLAGTFLQAVSVALSIAAG